MHSFPTNFYEVYRAAVVADVAPSGLRGCRAQLDYFLDRVVARDINAGLYFGRLSGDDVSRFPSVPGLIWYLYHPPLDTHVRDDLLPTPPGFLLIARGCPMPVYLHYGFQFTGVSSDGPAVHLIGGAPRFGTRRLPDGGLAVSIGGFPPGAAIVELRLSKRGKLKYETNFWQFNTAATG